MHYIQFRKGIPVEVHKFENLSDYESNFYIWTPPEASYHYEYLNGKRGEFIYAFLFQLTDQEKQDRIIKGGRWPERLDAAIITLELIFEKERREYGGIIRRAFKTRAPFYMVTNEGVFDERAVSGGYTCKYDITLGDHKSVIASTYVDAIAEKRTGTHLENTAYALGTNVLGDYMYVKTPKWYSKAVELYGIKNNESTDL
ncbi:hypothetical protein PHABIO_330 [Pseudomonas phage Phabio]|uniref:Uncharacterized protein n=1 Tax=Pseudomonas phage Phabio TaxID=2006668 RepID=A0A1Y0STX9_9CAUD|nr:hypothetical protein MZD05_gp330 [Pseudomonas phage Phabio]ARV76961.1 hypothetical protein PHABIO_330 [Pseudomonas phage Phabio]